MRFAPTGNVVQWAWWPYVLIQLSLARGGHHGTSTHDRPSLPRLSYLKAIALKEPLFEDWDDSCKRTPPPTWCYQATSAWESGSPRSSLPVHLTLDVRHRAHHCRIGLPIDIYQYAFLQPCCHRMNREDGRNQFFERHVRQISSGQ